MIYESRRNKLLDMMQDNSIAIITSGKLYTSTNDQNFPYEVERNFFYFTGLQFPGMKLIFIKSQRKTGVSLSIPRGDPSKEKWTGHIPTKNECSLISGIDTDEIVYKDEYNELISSYVNLGVEYCYLYTDKLESPNIHTERNTILAGFSRRFQLVKILDLDTLTIPMRSVKDEHELNEMKQAIHVTKLAIEEMVRNIKPGMKEYEAQAIFEYVLKKNKCGLAFATISASGKNAVTLHYISNDDDMNDNELLLFDCGGSYNWYNADVTRTVPVNGKFTERQLEIYNIVLKANKEVINAAKPGLTIMQLNEIVKNIFSDELQRIGLITSSDEVTKYYFHSVSHSLGLDTHDVFDRDKKLVAGNVITVEPGLYISEYGIGIRIEDDVLITENGCDVLTKDIIKEPEEIEEFMQDWCIK